jgi:hypothetical protein
MPLVQIRTVATLKITKVHSPADTIDVDMINPWPSGIFI